MELLQSPWFILILILACTFLGSSILFLVLWQQSVEDNNATWILYDELRDQCQL